MRLKITWALLAAPAAAAAIGVYFDGGLTAFGDLETEVGYRGFVLTNYEDLGASYWVGGGVVVPVWSRAAAVSPSLELATDAGFTSKKKEVESIPYEGLELSWKTAAVREYVVFGVAVGPVKPFVGFGAGVAIVPWTFTELNYDVELDADTEVKAAFGVPFGCEFRLTPYFALGARAEYLIVTGDVVPDVPVATVRASMPDPFLLAAVARVDF